MTEMDKLIKGVWAKIVETRPDYVELSQEELRYSLYFTDSFYSYVKALPHRYVYISGKAFSKVFIGILIGVILTGSVTVYAVFKIFQTKVNEKNTDISIDDGEYNREKIVMNYTPSFIPKDFEEVERSNFETSRFVRYGDHAYDIFFRQELTVSQGQIDNEETEEERIMIDGIEAIYFEKHQEKTLLYSNYGYVFYIDSNSPNVTKDDLVKMAESIMEE